MRAFLKIFQWFLICLNYGKAIEVNAAVSTTFNCISSMYIIIISYIWYKLSLYDQPSAKCS